MTARSLVEDIKSSKAIRGLSKALWDSDLIATRVSLAIGEAFWAIMLLWPGNTFGRPTYHAMSQVMSEEAWGLLILVSAVTQLTIVMEGALHSKFARIFSCWNACLWVFLVLSMMLSVSPPPAAIGGEFALTASACWVWLRPYILQGMYDRFCDKCDYGRWP